MVDLTKLDAAVTAQHLGRPEGEIGRALADWMAERNRPVYEAAIKRVGLQPGERLIEIGFGNGKLVPHLLALAPGAAYRRTAVAQWNVRCISSQQYAPRGNANGTVPKRSGAAGAAESRAPEGAVVRRRGLVSASP